MGEPGFLADDRLNSPSLKEIAVVIVNWNSWRETLACLASLRTSTDATWHLFLVDNASTDDSCTHFYELGDDVTVLISKNNSGWTGGNNIGINAALAAGYDQFLILNNDAKVRPDTIAILTETSFHIRPKAILGPIHFDDDGVPDFIGAGIDSSTGMPSLPDAQSFNRSLIEAVYPTSYVRGAGMFVDREHFKKVGLFDDNFYLNYDESDWCFRARALGYPVLMARDASILHTCSGSIGGVSSPLNTYFMIRNGLLFGERHTSIRQRLKFCTRLLRDLSRQGGNLSRSRRILNVAFGRDRRLIAARIAIRDYILRRFGDCPRYVRKLSASR